MFIHQIPYREIKRVVKKPENVQTCSYLNLFYGPTCGSFSSLDREEESDREKERGREGVRERMAKKYTKTDRQTDRQTQIQI